MRFISMTKSNLSPSSDILFIATDRALTRPTVNARVKHSTQRLQSFFHQLGCPTEALGEAPMTNPLPWMIHEIIKNIFREGHFLMALCDTARAGRDRRTGARQTRGLAEPRQIERILFFHSPILPRPGCDIQ